MARFLRSLFYQANLLWVRTLLFLVTTRDVKGKENVPRRGPLILASNHLNNADSPILTGTFPREIAWLTKAEWFRTPVIGRMFRMAGMIPVRRFEADLGALRKAQEVLKQGRVLGMFPEGTRSRVGYLQPAEPGTALIALRTGAPIQPVAIWGTENVKLPRDIIGRTHAHVRFGKPFSLPKPARIDREEIERATAAIMESIAALLPEQYRGEYQTQKEDEAARSGREP
jgi:1-acyl-sn-glycerol-3-phosphate acyltransferase